MRIGARQTVGIQNSRSARSSAVARGLSPHTLKSALSCLIKNICLGLSKSGILGCASERIEIPSIALLLFNNLQAIKTFGFWNEPNLKNPFICLEPGCTFFAFKQPFLLRPPDALDNDSSGAQHAGKLSSFSIDGAALIYPRTSSGVTRALIAGLCTSKAQEDIKESQNCQEDTRACPHRRPPGFLHASH